MSRLLVRWGNLVVRIRWLVLVAAVGLAAAGVGWGSGVFGSLMSGGFDDPASESVKAQERIIAELGQQDIDLVILYSSDTATVDDPAFREPVLATVAGLRERSEVAQVASYYETTSPALVSEDRHATFAAITLNASGEDDKRAAYDALRTELTAPGLTTQVGGLIAFQDTVDELTERDLARGEMFAFPVVLVLSILIFGGVVAAGMPLLIGVLAILGALIATRLIATATDVSTFAVNTIILLGLGMAIDYSLLIVSRFREELRAGFDPPQAVVRTMATAGRTVLVSGLTIVAALASLLIFPQVFLRSMGLGGMSAVLVATAASLTVLPAMLAVLGRRIDALRVPLPWRRRDGGRSAAADRHGVWAKLAHSVMRRPVVYLVLVLGTLAVLAQPFLHAQFGGVDERVMPEGTEARVVTERIAEEFPGRAAAPIETFLAGASTAQVAELVGQIRELPGVTDAQPTASQGDATGQVTFAKMIGVGMITAILVDATLVRMLLVPATLRLLGRWSWWAPGPLAALYRRHGIREAAEPAAAPTQPSLVP